MDRHALAVMIPVLAVFFGGLVILSHTAIGKALARRIGGQADRQPELAGEVEELRSELAALRGDLQDTQERLDFTERMIASGRKET